MSTVRKNKCSLQEKDQRRTAQKDTKLLGKNTLLQPWPGQQSWLEKILTLNTETPASDATSGEWMWGRMTWRSEVILGGGNRDGARFGQGVVDFLFEI